MALIQCEAKTLEDFVLDLSNYIKAFDRRLFNQPFEVKVFKSMAYLNMGASSIALKRKFAKFLGFKDEYQIYMRSSHLKLLYKIEHGAYCCAVHEVRHRFQIENKECLLTPSFIRQNHKYFIKQMYDYTYNAVFNKYGHDKDLFDHEFDASMIEALVGYISGHKKMTDDITFELLKCSEKDVVSILSKLY